MNLTRPPHAHMPCAGCSPDKNTLDQQLGKSDFVELRRMELERYLRKLAAHPVVVQAEVCRQNAGQAGQTSLTSSQQRVAGSGQRWPAGLHRCSHSRRALFAELLWREGRRLVQQREPLVSVHSSVL